MATYTLETPRGRKLTIESDSAEEATRLADRWDLEDHATSEAARLGVSPDLALRQMQRESGGNQNAVSPKGARGLMQLMPGTAKDLGVNPDDPYQNITGGLTYYKQQLDRYGGDERKALAAYNAGPGAVDRAGGVPSYPETQAYVGALAGKGGPAAPIPQRQPVAAPAVPTAQRVPQRAQAPVSGLADVALSAMSGIRKGAAGMADSVMQMGPVGLLNSEMQGAGSLLDLIHGKGPTGIQRPFNGMSRDAARNAHAPQTALGRVADTVGSYLPNAAIPGSLVSRAANVLMPAGGDLAGKAIGKAVGLDERGQNMAGTAGAVLGGGLASIKMPQRSALPKADLAELKATKTARYDKAEKSGFVFTPAEMDTLANDYAAHVSAKGGPKAAQLIPAADAMAARLKALAGQKGGVTLSQLDELRKDIYPSMIQKGGAEAQQGYELRNRIDGLMDATKAPFIKDARIANTKYEKAQEITDSLKSAKLAAGRSNSGQNSVNAMRQKLSPLVDPLHGRQMGNLTDAERALTEKIVMGDRVSNGLRDTSNLLRNKFVSGPAGLMASAAGLGPWGGLAVMGGLEGTGRLARGAAEGRTKAQIQDLLNLIAAGGTVPAPKPSPGAAYNGLAIPTSLMLSLGAAAPAAARPQVPQKRRQPK